MNSVKIILLVVKIILGHLGPSTRLTNPWAVLSEPLGPVPIFSYTLPKFHMSVIGAQYFMVPEVLSNIISSPEWFPLQHASFQVSIQTKNISWMYVVTTLWLHETRPHFLPRETDVESHSEIVGTAEWSLPKERLDSEASVPWGLCLYFFKEALVAPGSHPQRAAAKGGSVCQSLYLHFEGFWEGAVMCRFGSCADTLDQSLGQGGSHIKRWPLPFRPCG